MKVGLPLAIFLLAACAHQGDPPGGPPNLIPPKLIGTYPESTVVLPGFKGAAEFRFNEVINETQPEFGLGTGTLEKLILLSPDTAVPKVRWERNKITVQPRGGWKPNTVYRIELAPGITDLYNNVSKSRAVLTFSTGGPLPTKMLRGRAIDWATAAASPTAYIEALRQPEQTRYRTTVDSSGRFVLGPLPEGTYIVGASVDATHLHRRDLKAAWDTVRVGEGRDSVGEIWMFQQDTAPPKVKAFERADSLTIKLTFTLPLFPGLSLPAESVRVRLLPDSITLGAKLAMAQPAYDSLYRAPKPNADTTHHDSTAAARPPAPTGRAAGGGRGSTPLHTDPPLEKRPALNSVIMVRTTGLVQPGSDYFVEVHGVRMLNGVVGTAIGVLAVPKTPPVDTAKVRADSLAKLKTDSIAKAHSDSIFKAKADSIRRANGGRGGGAATRSRTLHWP